MATTTAVIGQEWEIPGLFVICDSKNPGNYWIKLLALLFIRSLSLVADSELDNWLDQ
jgi:hypothetical protein